MRPSGGSVLKVGGPRGDICTANRLKLLPTAMKLAPVSGCNHCYCAATASGSNRHRLFSGFADGVLQVGPLKAAFSRRTRALISVPSQAFLRLQLQQPEEPEKREGSHSSGAFHRLVSPVSRQSAEEGATVVDLGSPASLSCPLKNPCCDLIILLSSWNAT